MPAVQVTFTHTAVCTETEVRWLEGVIREGDLAALYEFLGDGEVQVTLVASETH